MQKVLTLLMNTLEIYPYPQFPLTCVVLINIWLHPQCRRVPSVNFMAIVSEWFHVLTIEDSDACKYWNVCYVSLNINFFHTNKKYEKEPSIDFYLIVTCGLPVTLVTWTYISITVVEDKTKFTKIMLPILKYPANNAFRELFLRHNGVSFLTILWKSRT
jgi:hypothetical protein